MSTATGQAPTLHRNVPRQGERSVRTVLLGCGIGSALLYVLTTVIAAERWEGYDSASQTVSELFAVDAPTRPLVSVLFLAHNVLLIGFAAGVWASAGGGRALRVTGGLLVGIGVVGTAVTVFFPIHLRGVEATVSDTWHAILTAVLVLLILLAIGFGATASGTAWRVYSIVTLVILLVFGALAGLQGPQVAANEPTPWLGVFERINIFGYLLWLLMLALALLRNHWGGRRLRCPVQTATGPG